MAQSESNKRYSKRQLKQLIQTLGPAFGPALILLSFEAYLSRIREKRSPFSPTFYKRKRVLPKASLEGRILSQEPYLRPTPDCNCHAPEMLALADQLRENTRNDWEYALKIFDFVRNEIAFAMEPFPRRGAVGTIEMGCGICFDKTNALIALARAGGIPARYCQIDNINALNGQAVPWVSESATYFQKWQGSPDWRLKTIGRGMFLRWKQQQESNYQTALWVGGHIMAELKVNNSWILADPTLSDEEAAGHSVPLPRLGYDPIALLGFQGSVTNRNESSQVGRGYWILRRLLGLISRGFSDALNKTLEERKEMGKLILEDIGEKEYMRRMRRYYIPLPQAVQLETNVFS